MSSLGSVDLGDARTAAPVATLSVRHDDDPAAFEGRFLEAASLTIESGACTVHVFAAAPALRRAAALLLKAACAIDGGFGAVGASAATGAQRVCGRGRPCLYPNCGCAAAVTPAQVWPFPHADPAERDRMAREHQAQQRDAIVDGPGALL